MSKIVYNACYGGFSLSDEAMKRYAEIKGITLYPEAKEFCGMSIITWWTVRPEERAGILTEEEWGKAPLEERAKSNKLHGKLSLYDRDIPRNDPALAQTVEELGEKANGRCANLAIAEVPDGGQYRIDEY